MNPHACLRIILLIFLKSSVVFAGEYCYFRGHIVNYCPTGKRCCSILRDQCCGDKIRGFSVWAILFISLFSLLLIIAAVYKLCNRSKSRRNPVENAVATRDFQAVPALNVPTADLYNPQQQQRIAVVFASYPRQETPVKDGNLPPPYPSDDDPPPAYPGCAKA